MGKGGGEGESQEKKMASGRKRENEYLKADARSVEGVGEKLENGDTEEKMCACEMRGNERMRGSLRGTSGTIYNSISRGARHSFH